MNNHPEILWAQNKDNVFVTLNVSDTVDPEIKIKEKDFSFEAISHQTAYKADFQWFGDINEEVNTYKLYILELQNRCD